MQRFGYKPKRNGVHQMITRYIPIAVYTLVIIVCFSLDWYKDRKK